MALNPAATKASRSLKEFTSSTVHPKMFPPNTRGDISNPVLPNLRLFILNLSSALPSSFIAACFHHALDEIPGRNGRRLQRLTFPGLILAFHAHLRQN